MSVRCWECSWGREAGRTLLLEDKRWIWGLPGSGANYFLEDGKKLGESGTTYELYLADDGKGGFFYVLAEEDGKDEAEIIGDGKKKVYGGLAGTWKVVGGVDWSGTKKVDGGNNGPTGTE